MKHMVTNLHDTNELVMLSKSILGSLFFDMFFRELEDELSTLVNSYKQYELLHTT